jgi:hypothetical protein
MPDSAVTYREVATYTCILKHTWEATEGPFSPFGSKECPKCGSASGLKLVSYRSVGGVQ